jgi:hypothetical protein
VGSLAGIVRDDKHLSLLFGGLSEGLFAHKERNGYVRKAGREPAGGRGRDAPVGPFPAHPGDSEASAMRQDSRFDGEISYGASPTGRRRETDPNRVFTPPPGSSGSGRLSLSTVPGRGRFVTEQWTEWLVGSHSACPGGEDGLVQPQPWRPRRCVLTKKDSHCASPNCGSRA